MGYNGSMKERRPISSWNCKKEKKITKEKTTEKRFSPPGANARAFQAEGLVPAHTWGHAKAACVGG